MSDQAGEKKVRRSKTTQTKKKKKNSRAKEKDNRPKKENQENEKIIVRFIKTPISPRDPLVFPRNSQSVYELPTPLKLEVNRLTTVQLYPAIL